MLLMDFSYKRFLYVLGGLNIFLVKKFLKQLQLKIKGVVSVYDLKILKVL